MNKFFLLQMILVILQCANFMWAVFFISNPLIAILLVLCWGFYACWLSVLVKVSIMWNACHIEYGKWGIYYPDCTLVWNQTYKTNGWVIRTPNWLNKV